MQQRNIGGRGVSEIGLGGMQLSIEGRPDEKQGIATIHAALDAGITLIDTADAYNRDANETGHNESLIAKALADYGDTSHVLVATKGGLYRPGDGSWRRNGDPTYLKEAAKASAKRLGVEAIDLYQFHRHDPDGDYATSVGAIRDLLDDGIIKMAGISNADIGMIEIAQQVLGGRLVSVQNEFSPSHTDSFEELRYCADHGLAFLIWGPLGGNQRASTFGQAHPVLERIAVAHGVSAQQVCLAWELTLDPVVIPIPGSRRPESIRDSALASTLDLTADEIATISAAILPASSGASA